MAKKQVLGRGLGALLGGDLPDSAVPAQGGPPGEQVVSLPLTLIDPNRDQPRRSFDEEALKELARSIENVGVLQPVLVQQTGERYRLIAGERRFRAARLAGLTELPAIIRDFDEGRRLEVALIENLQRDDLNPLEEAMGIRGLMEQCGYTQEQAAARLGKSRPAIANLLRILTLHDKVQQMVQEGKLSAGHARALAALPDKEAQLRLANLCVAQGWSVRQMERICKQTLAGTPSAPKKVQRPQEFRELERMARSAFGTRASLEGSAERGRLILNYYSAEDLQRIWDVLEVLGQNT